MEFDDLLGIAKNKTIRTGMVGSIAYGTNHEGSDTDYRSVYVAPPRLIASPFILLNTSEIKDPGEDDSLYWELGHFLQNAPQNPSMLDLLYLSDDLVSRGSMARLDQKLVKSREDLLSRNLIFGLLGHASRDLKVMRRQDRVRDIPAKPNALAFMYKDEAFKRPVGKDFFCDQSGNPRGKIIFESKDTKRKVVTISYYPGIDMPLLNEQGDLIKDKNRPNENEESKLLFFDMADFKRHMAAYKDRRTGPGKTSKRHALFERFGFDTKTAASALRLSRMALELAESGAYNLRRHDAEELKSIILDGSRTADSIENECMNIKKLAYSAAKNSPLAEQPNWKAIERLYNEIMEVTHPDRSLDKKSEYSALNLS